MECRDDECSLFNPYIDFGIKIDRLLTANDIAKGHNPGSQGVEVRVWVPLSSRTEGRSEKARHACSAAPMVRQRKEST